LRRIEACFSPETGTPGLGRFYAELCCCGKNRPAFKIVLDLDGFMR